MVFLAVVEAILFTIIGFFGFLHFLFGVFPSDEDDYGRWNLVRAILGLVILAVSAFVVHVVLRPIAHWWFSW
jgi:hypothetical protein